MLYASQLSELHIESNHLTRKFVSREDVKLLTHVPNLNHAILRNIWFTSTIQVCGCIATKLYAPSYIFMATRRIIIAS